MMNREQGTGNRKNEAVKVHLNFAIPLTPGPSPGVPEEGRKRGVACNAGAPMSIMMARSFH
jgi:hypothetical protein